MSCRQFRIVILSLFLLGEFSVASADVFEGVRQQIREALVNESLPSMSVAVARKGEFIWQEGFGWASRAERIPATEHTMYSIASISKPITATGVMVLVADKKVDLDRPINDYLDEQRVVANIGHADDATVRRLANHTSGLPLHYHFFHEDEPYPLPGFNESIRRYGRLVNPPGESYQYANFGYGILGHVISQRSGLSYGDFLRQRVFLPLGMTHTAEGIPAELREFAAVRYGADGRPISFYNFDHPGASAIYSSAHDLVRFGLFHLKHRLPDQRSIVSDGLIDEMQRPTATTDTGASYGVGWFINNDEFGQRTVSHSGGMGGVRTRLVLVPTEGLAVAVLCNAGSDAPLKICREILSVLIPSFGAKYRESRTPRPDTPPVSAELPAQLRGQWEGGIVTHEGARKIMLRIQRDGDIHARIDNQLITLVNQPAFRDNTLTGVFNSDLKTADANRRSYQLSLRLKLRGDKLNGSITALSQGGGKWLGNALSHWVELQRIVDSEGVLSMFDGRSLENWRPATKFDFAQGGTVEVRNNEIRLGHGNPATGIVWDGLLPRTNYEISMEAKRVDGQDFFCGLTFPVSHEYCTLIIGGWGGSVTGLSNINGMAAVENETTDSQEFKTDTWYQIRLRVTNSRIDAWVNDKSILGLDREGKKFSVWWEQEPMRPLGIATWNTSASLRNIQLKLLDY